MSKRTTKHSTKERYDAVTEYPNGHYYIIALSKE